MSSTFTCYIYKVSFELSFKLIGNQEIGKSHVVVDDGIAHGISSVRVNYVKSSIVLHQTKHGILKALLGK